MTDSWEEVARLRKLAEDAARIGDTLLAAYYDTRASQMAERLRGKRLTILGRNGATLEDTTL